METITIIFLLLALFVVLYAATGLKIVRQSETVVVERLGRYNRTLESGINIIWPIIDKPRQIVWRYVIESYDRGKIVKHSTKTRIDLRESVYDFPRQNVITRDNVSIEINALLYFLDNGSHKVCL